MTNLNILLKASITLAGFLLVIIGAYLSNSTIFIVGIIQFIVLFQTFYYFKDKKKKEWELKVEKIALPIVTFLYLGLDVLIIILFYTGWWG